MAETSKVGRLFNAARWLLLPGLVAAFGAISWGLYGLAVRGEAIEVSVQPVRMDRENAPAWLPKEHIEELERMVAEAVEGRRFFDPELTEVVAKALGRSHWTLWDESEGENGDELRRPRVRVRRRFPSRLDCEIAIREPFAGVRVRDGKTFIIDEETVQLPLYYEKDDEVPLPLIEGTRSYPPGPGKTWRDRAVEAGAQIVKALTPLLRDDDQLALRAVEVKVTGQLPSATLRTASGLRITWGIVYQPGREPLGLHSAEERIEAVKRFLKDAKPEEIDLIDASGLPISYKPKNR